MRARGGRTPLITQLLSPSSPVCRADKSASNDKMRLTLNLGDDAMYPAGHPLSPCCLSGSLSLSLFSPPMCHGKEEWRREKKMQTSRSDCVPCQHDVTGVQCLWQ